jgi:hypothetical protein
MKFMRTTERLLKKLLTVERLILKSLARDVMNSWLQTQALFAFLRGSGSNGTGMYVKPKMPTVIEFEPLS